MALPLSDKKLAILEEITAAILATDDIGTISSLLVDLAVRHTDAEKGSLLLVEDLRELGILSSRGIDRALARDYRCPVGEGIAGLVAEAGEPVLVNDVENDPRYNPSVDLLAPKRSFIACPISIKGEVAGVLMVHDKVDGGLFTGDDLSLVRSLVGQAALILEKRKLLSSFKSKKAEAEEANRKLIAVDMAKTDFLTRLSHELRTPLNGIKGASCFLQSAGGQVSGGQQEFLDIISAETDNLLSIVNSNFDLIRLEEDVQVVSKEFVPLGSLLWEIAGSGLVRKVLSPKNLQLEIDIHAGLPDVVVDKILVGQLFANLFEGVASHLHDSGSIRISVQDNAVIEICMQASGNVPEPVLEQTGVVKNVYRADRHLESVKFFLAARVAESHGWSMTLSNTSEGFQVRLLIPKGRETYLETAVTMTMDRLLGFTSEILGVDTCSIMLCDKSTGDMTIRSARGLEESIIKQTRIRVGDRIAGWVALEGRPILVEDIENDPRFGHKNIDEQYRSRSLLSLPLKSNGKVLGVLNLNNKKCATPFTEMDLKVASVLGERISWVVEKLYSPSEGNGDVRKLVASLDSLIEAGSRYPKKATRHVELMGRLTEALGCSQCEKELALYVSLVYDLGLVPIDEGVLGKKGPLSSLDVSAIQGHPLATLDLLGKIEFSEEVREIILRHHERFDGSGYPDGLKGEEIPFIARVLAVVDAFCAMTEKRPYRKQLSAAEALGEIRSRSGSWFDRCVVEALGAVVGDGKQ